MFGFLPPKRGKFDEPPIGTQPPLSEGLTTSFAFDENAGPRALDRARLGFGTIRSGDTFWQPPRGLACPRIDNGLLKGVGYPDFVFPHLTTIEMLFTPIEDLFVDAGVQVEHFFDLSTPNNTYLLGLRSGATILWQINIGGSALANINVVTFPLAGVTYHLALVIDETEVHLYIDGKLEGTSAMVGGGPSTSPQTLLIGDRHAYISFSRAIKSDIHFFRVLDGAKSVEQVQHMAQNPYRTDEPESPFMGVFDEAASIIPQIMHPRQMQRRAA